MGAFKDIVSNQQNTADNFVDTSDVKQILKKNSEDMHVIEGAMVVKTRDIAGSTIWDINNWDAEDSIWNETFSTGFILGSTLSGVLGVNKLGDSGADPVLFAVVNPENRFYTLFTEDLFEDTTNTTATWGPSGLVFGATIEIAQSSSIAYNTGTIFRATVEIEGTDTDNGDYFLSADGGVNWEEVTLGTAHDFTNTGTDLRFKFDNDNSETAGFPTPFGDWGASPSPGTMTLNKMTIKYEVS